MKKLLIFFMILCAVFGLIGCSSEVEKAKADIRGEITDIALNQSSKSISILVEGAIEDDTSYDKATVYVTDRASVIKAATGKQLTNDQLKVGMMIEVTFEGPIRESYPIQADAKEVRVLNQ